MTAAAAAPPRDDTLSTCLLFEPPVSVGNISPAGLDAIARHEYRSGAYTHLDNLLNPGWASLTELLPLWLAPNAVTALGFAHCALAYGVLWRYAPDFDAAPPGWALVLAGWCTCAYYTLDCMDGKQARRTGSSSPLGQLFDHGVDCLCTVFFISTVSTYLMLGGTPWFNLYQAPVQFLFFMAQWEEYHTHVLPHCTGKWLGVTETNYALALLAVANGFVDVAAVYQRPMARVWAPYVSSGLLERVPAVVRELELRNFLLCVWFCLFALLAALSVRRTMRHPRITDGPPHEVLRRRLNALAKLATPAALCVAASLVPPDAVRTRYLSIALGLTFALLTKKMVVWSMAKMAYAAVQWDAAPFVLAALWIRADARLTKQGADVAMGLVCLWTAGRVLAWVHVTIEQICKRLGIYCFTLKKRKAD